MRLALIVPALLFPGLLAAAPAVAQGRPYRAVGTEPFWSLDITGHRMRFADIGSERVVSVARPRAIRHGRRYVTRRLVVTITRRACSDGMSDRRYPDTVQVMLDGRRYDGCGGLPFRSGGERPGNP